MSAVEQQRETEVVVGTVTGLTQKRADTWTVTVQPDNSQYTKNLWTKDPQLVAAIPQYIGQRLSFTCGASHWTNNQGQPVRSLWVNEVAEAPPEGVLATIGEQGLPQAVVQQAAQPAAAPVLQLPAQQLPAPQAQQRVMAVETEDEKSVRIMRQTAAKCACWMLPTLPAEEHTFPHLVQIAEGWLAYFTRGRDAVHGLPPQGHVQGTGPAMQLPVAGLEAGFQSDDIPF